MTEIISFIQLLLLIVSILIIVRSIASWIPSIHHYDIVRTLFQITDSILEPIRRFVPPIGGIDLSPMIALAIMLIISRAISNI